MGSMDDLKLSHLDGALDDGIRKLWENGFNLVVVV